MTNAFNVQQQYERQLPGAAANVAIEAQPPPPPMPYLPPCSDEELEKATELFLERLRPLILQISKVPSLRLRKLFYQSIDLKRLAIHRSWIVLLWKSGRIPLKKTRP